MPTTYSATFKNAVVNWLTGRDTSPTNTNVYYVSVYNGVQPADPSTNPAGTCANSSYSYGPGTSGYMSAASGGVSSLSQSRPSNATGSQACPAVTFARLQAQNSVGIVDTPVSLAGNGGGVIMDLLTVSAGVSFNITGFSVKMPLASGTMMFNQALANRLAENISNANSTTPNVLTSANLYLYSGSPPATADLAATGVLLATFSLPATSPWASAVGGAAALGATLTVNATTGGTIGYFRAVKGVFTLQGTAGTTGTDITTDAAATTSSLPISITAGTITFG